MDIIQLQNIIASFEVHGYFILLVLMIFEGPITTALASFAASLGFFNIWIIFLLSVFGNIIPDTLFFLVGRFSRGKRIESFVKYFGLTENRIKKIEEGLHKHPGKVLVFAKLVPPLPVPTILLAGFTKLPIRTFLKIIIPFNLISAIISTILGYYFGLLSIKFLNYFQIGQYAFLLVFILVILIYFLYNKFSKKVVKKISSEKSFG